MVAELRASAEADPAYPPLLFFYQGSVADGEAFFASPWPAARAVADPDRHFYHGLGLLRGGMKEMFGPATWACGLRAVAKGHFIGRPKGDPWMMPGLFLVDGSRRLLWRHDFAHAGDHPDFRALPARMWA
jgi:hypothetical protein